MAKLENSEKQPEPIKKNRTWEKIKTVGKTAGTFLVGAVVVIGIGAIIVTSGFSALYLGGGFPSRSGNWGSSSSSKRTYNSHVNQPEKAKNTPVRGVGSELWHKIKTNPWKTLGTALLATAFPAGTIIAGAITAGVVGKSAYDSHVNQQAYKPQTVPPHALHSPTFVHKPSTTLSPSLTPKVTKVTHKGKHEGTRAR